MFALSTPATGSRSIAGGAPSGAWGSTKGTCEGKMPVWLSTVPWSHQICSGRNLGYRFAQTIERSREITVVQSVSPDVNHSNHGNGQFLPSRRNTWEEPVDSAIVGYVINELVWKVESATFKARESSGRNAPTTRSDPTVRETVCSLASAGFLD